MARGHKTGGRKPGSKNRRTKELETATADAVSKIEEALGEAFQGDAHALLIALYKDETKPIEIRLDAAKAAIRFEKPSLVSQASKTEVVHRYVARLPEKSGSTEEWQNQHEPPDLKTYQ